MSREFKHYKLRSVPKPFKHPLLLSEVAVTGQDGGAYYCYVAFSDTLVQKIGGYIPVGLQPGSKTFLSVQWDAGVNRWQVYAVHVSNASFVQETIYLWTTPDENPPPWLKFIKAKVKKDEAGTQKKARTGSC